MLSVTTPACRFNRPQAIRCLATYRVDCCRRRPDRRFNRPQAIRCCLLYTSDAADERSSVDLGGRRIIKKKKNVGGTERVSSDKMTIIRKIVLLKYIGYEL